MSLAFKGSFNSFGSFVPPIGSDAIGPAVIGPPTGSFSSPANESSSNESPANKPPYQSKRLDHLGLVAALYEELGIGAILEELLPKDEAKSHVTVGQAVKAMVLSGLGFANQTLYLTPHFFESKPTEQLIGPGVRPEHLNDDVLGDTLDRLYNYGVTPLYAHIAAHCADRLGLAEGTSSGGASSGGTSSEGASSGQYGHLDATSFHVDGVYNSRENAPAEGVVHIRPGYSREGRPELNQLVLDLICEGKAGLPLLMEVLDGNSSDQVSFRELIARHADSLQNTSQIDCLVADSALYSKKTIASWPEQLDFITRVPLTIREATEAVRQVEETIEAEGKSVLPVLQREEDGAVSYRWVEGKSSYGGRPQRWLTIYSEAACLRARQSAPKQLLSQSKKEQKAFSKLLRRGFACAADAEKALAAFEAKLEAASLPLSVVEEGTVVQKAHYDRPGRPPKGTEPDRWTYAVSGRLASRICAFRRLVVRKSLFILSTSKLDKKETPALQVLQAYKRQSTVERGFRFLKDPKFVASTFFLKNESRITALLMVMTLCLLVYSALQWRIREGLASTGEAYPDQKGKPTRRPTARWVFQSFVGIEVLFQGERPQDVLNLKPHHQVLLKTLGRRYEQQYSLLSG